MFHPPHPRSAHRANQGSGLATLARPALFTVPGLTRTPPAQHRRPAIPAQRRRSAGTTQPIPYQPTPHRRAAVSLTERVESVLQAASTALTHRLEAALRPATLRPGRPAPSRTLRHGPQEPGEALHFLLSGLGALIILSIITVSIFFVIAEEQRGPAGDTSAALAAPASISSRRVDATPLTGPEVFPGPQIIPAGAAPYEVTSSKVEDDCGLGATGDLTAVLAENGCSQLVRARLTAPYGGYQVTAGVFNLADEVAARQVSDRAGTLVEAGTGTFASLIPVDAGSGVPPLAQVNWHARGHYLLYCVISRPDGALVADDDPYAARITADLIERHLAGQVIARRATTS
ncbi:hypothetical protein COUCH_35105 [Couchioplanes caeruleus]|uniref:hypothetical protein n=1 Tax=Couchioplanes caeruleus TaxID=56438 RepID=UPI0020C12655|nr:hypothetical protein [Couchioplanes caeruleus]UQU64143.1 hypothetical protein COUCH_35105 [Couchioplanes caeruleus]